MVRRKATRPQHDPLPIIGRGALMTDHVIETHTCIHCGGYGNFSETVGRDVIWRCSFRAGKPWCKVKGTK